MIIVYGIPNCDTVKKTRAWLTARALPYCFHDFKKSGVPACLLPTWIRMFGAFRLVNRQGTTWRKLDTCTQNSAIDDTGAMALMMAQPSVIKRPVVDGGNGNITVGFDTSAWTDGLPV